MAPVLDADEILHDRSQRRDAYAQADRAGGEIDIVVILGSAGIALHPAIAAEVLHLLACLVAHEIVHGVKNGGGMRFDRHPVLRP